jgi:hypothetical protein
MLNETRDKAGRGQAGSRPGKLHESAVAEASAVTQELGGANLSTSMKQNAAVDNASESRQLAEQGLATRNHPGLEEAKGRGHEASEGADHDPANNSACVPTLKPL